MTTHLLTHDTQATLLLCATLGQARTQAVKPLSQSEYYKLAEWLYKRGLRPAHLLQTEALQSLQEDEIPIKAERLAALLVRGGALALTVESWTSRGGWILSRSDSSYPARLKTQLKHSSPPILYGIGNLSLLDVGGLAVVGSRNTDEAGLDFTRDVACCCAQQGLQVISGGARGVDSEAMLAALKAGGTVVGVLANELAKAAISGKYRDALRNGQLVLVSPYDPGARFNVGHAMARNKYIYRLSEWSLVVSSGLGKGGTWEGAIENLRHGWVPLSVRDGEGVPKGNKRLIELGGVPFDGKIIATNGTSYTVLPFDSEKREVPQTALPDYADSIVIQSAEEKPLYQQVDLFPLVWPHIRHALAEPKTIGKLKDGFVNIHKAQLQAWIRQAIKEGLIKEDKETKLYSLVEAVALKPLTDDYKAALSDSLHDDWNFKAEVPQQISLFSEV